ncbi:MAG: SUMF1/EgtB/PvdO family nonheme iron enzyme [Vulcanimicrobiota bacterium]
MAQFCSICGKSARDSAKFCQRCGTPFVQILQAGTTLDRDRYEVLKPLKSGGMGAVYLLHDNRLERKCVLKEMIPPSHDPAELKEFRERFRNEALTLSKLSHPNLPPVYDHFEENHQCCLVMEYIEGDDLESLLAAQAPKGFPEERVRQWALTICSILEYLHSQKPLILYRDLKPSNIMLRKRDERLFLIDFGLAKSVHQALTHKTSWGTEGYAPIEQCQGEPEVRSDLYALGATMHHLLSGRPPVPFKFPAIRSLRPEISSAMEALLERALKLHAHERYGTAREMREALEGCGAAPKKAVKIVNPAQAPVKAAQPGVSPAPVPAPAKSAQSHVGSSLPPAKAAQIRLSPSPAGATQSGVSPVPSLPATMTNTNDGADMVLIPAGEFQMGNPEGQGSDDERPQHRVYLDAFYIYKYQVTNGQFTRFVKETGYNAEGEWMRYAKSGRENHPVVNVTWNDAAAYCKWAGGKLPTEAQWEKAARGTDGRMYPWGNTWDGNRCNWDKGPKVAGIAYMSGGRGTAPVGSFPSGVSPYGVHDMAGNVWEWCSDWYDESYYQSSPSRNPEGPGRGSSRVLRGGSWYNDDTDGIRCAVRGRITPDYWNYNYGFRVCRPSITP